MRAAMSTGTLLLLGVDVVVRDGEHVLIEVKSRVSRSVVAELRRIGKLYEEVCGVRPS